MTLSRNLSRARSHIIFIVALLSAAAYILWVENSRGDPAAMRPDRRQWQVEFGAFDNAAAAGGHWDRLRGRLLQLRGVEAKILEAPDGVRLQAGPLPSQRSAVQICDAVRAGGVACDPISPGL